MERNWSGLVSLFVFLLAELNTNMKIVIVLIAVEILVAVLNIIVDLSAGD